MTRDQQRRGNKIEADGDKGDEVMKKPARRAKAKASPKGKASAKAKASPKGKAKAKANANKSKTTPYKRPSSKVSEKPKLDMLDLVIRTPKRRLFDSDKEDQEDEGSPCGTPNKSQPSKPAPSGPASDAVEPQPKRRLRRKATEAMEPLETAGKEGGTKPEAKQKAKAKARANKNTEKTEQEPQPKKKSRRSSKLPDHAEVESDEVMLGVFMQVFKESSALPFDEFKSYLNKKKPALSSGNVALNVYWTKGTSAVRLMSVGPPYPDAAYFFFKNGSWNSRMAAAFMASVLMVTWLGIGDRDSDGFRG